MFSHMPIYFRPMSNNERQRQFRARNPGYYKKYNMRTRRTPAEREAARAAMVAMLAAEADVMTPAPLPRPAPAVVPATAGADAIRANPLRIAA